MSVLYLLLVLGAICFELFIINSVRSFLTKGLTIKTVGYSLLSSIIVIVALYVGIRIGYIIGKIFDARSLWFGSSILFILSLKYLYEGIRLKQIRKTINPLDNKGFILLMISPFINSIFAGVSLGLLQIQTDNYKYLYIVSLCLALLGSLTGIFQKKLIGFRYEIVVSIILLLNAILLVI